VPADLCFEPDEQGLQTVRFASATLVDKYKGLLCFLWENKSYVAMLSTSSFIQSFKSQSPSQKLSKVILYLGGLLPLAILLFVLIALELESGFGSLAGAVLAPLYGPVLLLNALFAWAASIRLKHGKYSGVVLTWVSVLLLSLVLSVPWPIPFLFMPGYSDIFISLPGYFFVSFIDHGSVLILILLSYVPLYFLAALTLRAGVELKAAQPLVPSKTPMAPGETELQNIQNLP
jgi:hypothetical protein